MSLRQKAFTGLLWSIVQSWGGRAIAFIIFFLLARLLEPQAFGLVALASVYIGFVQLFIDQGFGQAIVQRKDLEPEHLDTAFWTNLAIGFTLMALSLVTADPVAQWFNEPRLVPVIRWLSLNFPLSALNGVQQAVLNRQFVGFKVAAIRALVGSAVGGSVGVWMAFSGFGVWSLVAQQLIRNSVSTLLLWQACDWKPGFRLSFKHFKELFNFGINITGLSILSFFNTRTDDLLIGKFLGPEALGYYNVAYQLLLMLNQLLRGTTSQVGLTTFSRMQDDPEKLKRTFYSTTQLMSVVTFPIFFGIAVMAPELVPPLFGDQWLPSIPVMQLLACVGILQSFFSLNGIMITAMGKPDWNLKLLFLNTAANVAAFAVVVKWGIIAVAASRLVSDGLIAPIRLGITRKLINFQLGKYLGQYVAPLTGSAVMAIAMWGLRYLLRDRLDPIFILMIGVGVGTVIYGTVIYAIAPKLVHSSLALVRQRGKRPPGRPPGPRRRPPRPDGDLRRSPHLDEGGDRPSESSRPTDPAQDANELGR